MSEGARGGVGGRITIELSSPTFLLSSSALAFSGRGFRFGSICARCSLNLNSVLSIADDDDDDDDDIAASAPAARASPRADPTGAGPAQPPFELADPTTGAFVVSEARVRFEAAAA